MLASNKLFKNTESNFKRIHLMCKELSNYLSKVYEKKIVDHYINSDVMSYYESCSFEEQNNIFQALLAYYSLMVDAVSQEVELTNPSEALLHSLSWNNFETDSRIYKHLGPYSVIEMFDLNFRQTWRSNNFFKYSSHSLTSLFCKPFPMNFKKVPSSIETDIMLAVGDVLEGRSPFVENITKDHRIVELASPKLVENKGSLTYVSKLKRGKDTVGIVSVINLCKKA